MSLFSGGPRGRWLVRRLGLFELSSLTTFLGVDPIRHAFLNGWLHSHGIVSNDPSLYFEFSAACDGERIAAVALLISGSFLCVSDGEGDAANALAQAILDRGILPGIVSGPADSVASFRDVVARRAGSASLREQPQMVYRLRSRDLRYIGQPLLRRADHVDLDALHVASIAMHAEEIGRAIDAEDELIYRSALSQQILERRIWCVTDPIRGELLFKAGLTASAPSAAMIEGVYVPPAHRRTGVARAALSELCRRLLLAYENVVLQVQKDNASAVRLYEGLGFRALERSTTLLVGNETAIISRASV